MLTVKQKLLSETITKFFNKIHKKTTVFSEDYCKKLVKATVQQLYAIYPDRNVGKISVNWFDEKYVKTPSITEKTYCFEINFFDVYTGIPWMVCRFYKGVSKVGIYISQ